MDHLLKICLLLLAPIIAVRPASGQDERASADADAMRRRAAAYLWSQQGEDGGWHSTTYALLRSGQAYTPFILHALLNNSDDPGAHQASGTSAALDFIRSKTSAEGVLGVADPDILEYPNYATSYALRSLLQASEPQDQVLVRRIRAYLVRQQYCAATGFTRASAAYGGWGFGGSRPLGDPGHMDLAHTRRVLQALRQSEAASRGQETAMYDRAQVFLRYVQRHPQDKRPQPGRHGEAVISSWDRQLACQVAVKSRQAGSLSDDVRRLSEAVEASRPTGSEARPTAMAQVSEGPIRHGVPDHTYDGGFYFSPIVLMANKGLLAGSDSETYYRSYATATCDGVLALLAAGVPRSDERVLDAYAWLLAHPELDYPPGIPGDHPEPWRAALRMYHFAVRAEVYAALGWPAGAAERMTGALAEWQEADGRFVNRESALMKEDDPLLCTALAVIALSYLP